MGISTSINTLLYREILHIIIYTYSPQTKQQQLLSFFIMYVENSQSILIYNIRMVQKYVLILLLITICHPSSIIIGGYAEANEQSQQSAKIVSLIKTSIPILEKWKVDSIRQQIVNGVNYMVTLTYTGNTAQVIVYSTFAGKMKVTSFKINSKNQPILQQQKDSQSITQNITNSNSTVNDVYLKLHSLNTNALFLGGYQLIPLNDNSYTSIWDKILQVYPYMQNYTIIQIRRQVVAGLNYIFVTQSEGKDKEIVIKVYESLEGNSTINIVQTNTAVGITSQAIIAFNDQCIKLKPQLADYQLISIQNQSSQGLKLVYSAVEDSTIATCKLDGANLQVVLT